MKCVVYAADPPGCAQGFWDVDVLKHVMAATSVTAASEKIQHLPYLTLNCISRLVKKLFVGAKITKNGTPPQVHFKQHGKNPKNSYLISNLTSVSLNATPYLNVYEYKVPLSSSARIPTTGLYTTIINGDSQVYFLRDELKNSTVIKPLLFVDIGQNFTSLHSLIFH